MKVLSDYHNDVIVIELSLVVLAVLESVYWRICVFEGISKCIFKYLLMAASTVKIIEISRAFTEVM